MRRTETRRIGAVMLVIAGVVAGMLVATALASGGHATARHRGPRWAIAVFSHHPKGLARIASAGAPRPPASAILAAVVGKTEVYVSKSAGGEDCLEHFTVSAAAGGGCAPATQVEEQGSVGIFQEGEGATAAGSPATLRVTALVPNGVPSVKFTDRDGSSYQVAVTDNVIEHEDINTASVSYTLPDGVTRTTNVEAVVNRTRHQPGPAGSSR
jgi:hypothetical protein